MLNFKSSLYQMLRIWNTMDAVRKGRGGKRTGRRMAMRTAGLIIRKLLK